MDNNILKYINQKITGEISISNKLLINTIFKIFKINRNKRYNINNYIINIYNNRLCN